MSKLTQRDHEEAVSAICTHKCRKVSGLIFSLDACRARKEKFERYGGVRGGNIKMGYTTWECAGCEGPIEIEGRVMKKDEGKQCICRECGSSFERYRRGAVIQGTICKDCIRRRAMDRKAEMANANELKLVLDFEEDREIYEKLAVLAKRERRGMVAQAMVCLEMAIK